MKLLYIHTDTVIPAPIFIGLNSSGNPAPKDWIPDQVRNDNQKKETTETLYYIP